MNKPAPKEPSMDEILSSIRQIIADDDAAAAPRKPFAPAPAASSLQASPPPRPVVPAAAPAPEPAAADEEPEPLALMPSQMLRDDDEPEEPATSLNFDDMLGGRDDPHPESEEEVVPQLVDPEDVAFDSDDAAPAAPLAAPAERPASPPVNPVPRFAATPAVPPSTPPRSSYASPSFSSSAAASAASPRPAPSVARAAPMPDPTLSQDMAEKLLAPATDAAVRHTFAKLSGVAMPNSGMTLDSLMRDMLRPMLKEWLDENLPAVVERMVEKEIARISRGGE